MKVVIAEDDDAQRETLQALLEEEGFEVESFEDGSELNDFFEIDAKARWPEVVVTDVVMPGHPALSALQTARQKGFDGLVVVVTAEIDPEVRATFSRLRRTLVLTKPIDFEHLARAIRELAQLYH